MKVYTLVGESGTGKSHRAVIVAYNYNISLIIDDGLLIYNGKIIAGKSAKREKSKIAAVRAAIFENPKYAQEIKQAILETNENKILVIGTSVNMVKKIVERLDLPEIYKFIDISDVATREEINKAKYIREKEGKHVIPIPKIEIKSQFSGYFVKTLNIIFNKDDKPIKREKTIVRPAFSYYGNLIIYNKVFNNIINYKINQFKNIKKCKNINFERSKYGLNIKIEIILKYGLIIPEYVKKIQKSLALEIENITGIEVLNVNIEVLSLVVPGLNNHK